MTTPLQIGDIVRINAPTPEEKSILAELYDAITDDDTGRLAVVIDIKHQSNPLVSVVPCDENFELTVEGIPELQVNNVMTGVSTQLTLVREGLLRSCVISEAFPQPLGGSQIPSVGTTTSIGFTVFNERSQNIIAVVSFIERIGTFRKGIFVDFTNDGDWNRVTIITEGLVQPPRASTTF